jgi:acetyl-CoA C-acetyltransferase
MGRRTAVVVGVGQLRRRPELDGPFRPIEPARMIETTLERAERDSGVAGLARQADFVGTIPPIAWSYDDLPGRVAEEVGAKPAATEAFPAGGEGPIALLNRVAERIRDGETRVALLCGAEALYGRRRAVAEGVPLDDWTPGGDRRFDMGGQRPLANELEARHGLTMPIHMYPLFENALRAEAGRSIDEHQVVVSELMARFSEVAARNPYAWFPERRTAEELRRIDTANRWICFPYPKLVNAIISVDQAASAIVTSDEEADRLGIPPERRVAFLGGAKGIDAWTPTERVDFTSSPAYLAASRRAFEHAGLGVDDVDLFDLYSCFPCAVELALAALGLETTEPRPLTVTGGLSFAGGPGNNYAMHALANLVDRLRAGDGPVGYVSGLGMSATKHAVAILSTDSARVSASQGGASEIALPPEKASGPELADAPDGPGRIETYTVSFTRDNEPESSILVVRLDDGRRTVAHGERTPAAFARLLRSEGIGLRGTVHGGADGAPNRFALDA